MQVAIVAARCEAARMRVLAASIARHEPDARCVVLVLDADRSEDGEREPFELLCPADLGIDGFGALAARLDLEELRAACVPLLVAHLRDARPLETVLSLEPDSLVLGSLSEIDRLAFEHGVLIWPRTDRALPPDGRRPNEADLHGWGLHDGGVIAVGGTAEHGEMFAWWGERARAGRGEQHGAPPSERLGTLAGGSFEVRDPGLGASFWNLHARTIRETDANGITVDGSPLALLRLTGFDPQMPAELSRYQDRVRLVDHPPLARACSNYAADLLLAGEEHIARVPYGWGSLPDGTVIDERFRRILARAQDEGGLLRSPFTRWGMEELYAWLAAPAAVGAESGLNRLCTLVCELQPELAAAYPDLTDPAQARGLLDWLHAFGVAAGTLPSSLLSDVSPGYAGDEQRRLAREPLFGVNVAGYFSSELGVGESARLVVAALDSASVPLLPLRPPGPPPPSRQGHPFTALPPSAGRFPVNLLCVNADGLPPFREQAGERFFAGRHNIGLWWWEVGRFPAEWEAAFALLDEVWVGSAHVADTLAATSPVPVYTVTLPVLCPGVAPISRERVGLREEDYEFLFMFDFKSVFERKNPLGVVRAFVEAFEPLSGAVLLMKAINGEHDPANLERLRAAVRPHPHVHLLEGYLSPQENHALIAGCDCYVSMHRAEGFGLTPAEAMALGKPVIATGYSGNLEFMTAANSYLVEHTLIPIGPGNWPYPADGRWAEPDVAHASRLMREVFEDPEAARARGARGAEQISRSHSLAAAGESMRRRLEALHPRIGARRGVNTAGEQADGGLPYPRGPVKIALRPDNLGNRWRERLRRALLGRYLTALVGDLARLQTAVDQIDVGLAEVAGDAVRTQAAALAALRAHEREQAAARAPQSPLAPSNGIAAYATGSGPLAALASSPAPDDAERR